MFIRGYGLPDADHPDPIDPERSAMAPTSVSWSLPDGFRVTLDEDGIILHSERGGMLQDDQIEALFRVVDGARQFSQTEYRPRCPTYEEVRAEGVYRRKRAIVSRLKEALDEEFL